MNVTVLTAFWRRPAISRVYWSGIRRLRDLGVCNLSVAASMSPGDDENWEVAKENCDLVAAAVLTPNDPLASKWNAASQAARDTRADYVLIMGSDDLLSDTLFKALVCSMQDGIPHHGITDLYLWDSELGRAGYWSGYHTGPRTGRSIGLGRFYSRALMDACDWRLWPTSEEKCGMDGLADERLKAMGVELRAQSCARWGGVALDVKSKDNIWSYDRLTRVRCDPLLMRSIFPELSLLGQTG